MRKKLIVAIVILSVLLAAAVGTVIFLESGRNPGGNGGDDGTAPSLILETEGESEFNTPEVTFSNDDSGNNRDDLPESTIENEDVNQNGETETRDPDENALLEQEF